MKRFIFVTFMLLLSALMVGCASGPEARGEAAWREAMRAPEGSATRLTRQRTAFVNFREAYYEALSRGSVSPRLLNRYLETAIVRAGFIFEETQDPTIQPLVLIRQDIEAALSQEGVSPENRDAYAQFLITLARHHYSRDGVITRALEALNTAREVAFTTTMVDAVIREITNEFVELNTAEAQLRIAEAQRSRQPLDFIRAEYYARVVQHFDAENEEAARILGITRRELVSFLTAFEAAITEYPDTALFRKINSDGVIKSVQSVTARQGNTTVAIEMHNASFANIRPEASQFSLVLVNGNVVEATAVAFDRRYVNQRHTVPGRLTFRGNIARNNIARIEFRAQIGDESVAPIVGTKFMR